MEKEQEQKSENDASSLESKTETDTVENQTDISKGTIILSPRNHRVDAINNENLEKLNGINYKKGCYTGQEIVARTHYLGKIKKQIFLISHNSKLINIADKIHDENNEILGEVISDNQTVQEKTICLAVVRLDAAEKDLYANNQKINLIN